MTATPAWLASIEALLNRQLAVSTQASALARSLEGKSADIGTASLIRLRMEIASGRLFLSPSAGTPAAVEISGSLSSLLAPVPGSLVVHGDAEVASRFRDLLRLLRPDLEEELSRHFGDVPAHAIASGVRSLAIWGRRALGIVRENTAEYLQEESRMLVNRTELDEFLHGVDRLRELADRVDARLESLEKHAGALH